jgi:hypothetical protein
MGIKIILLLLLRMIFADPGSDSCKSGKFYYFSELGKIDANELDRSNSLIESFVANSPVFTVVKIQGGKIRLIETNVLTKKKTTTILGEEADYLRNSDILEMSFINPNKVALIKQGEIIVAEYPSFKIITQQKHASIDVDNVEQITNDGIAYVDNKEGTERVSIDLSTGEVSKVDTNTTVLAIGEILKASGNQTRQYTSERRKIEIEDKQSLQADLGSSIVTIFGSAGINKLILPNNDTIIGDYWALTDNLFGGTIVNSKVAMFDLRHICLDQKIVLPTINELCDCDWTKPSKTMEVIDTLSKDIRCEADYSSDVWPDKDKSSLSGLYENLLRLQKLKSFDIDKDLPFIIGLLEQGYDSHFPNEIRSALQSMFVVYPDLVRSLLNKYPRLTKLKNDSNFKPCRSAKENEEILKATLRSIENQDGSEEGKSTKYWDYLNLFSDFLSTLDDRKKAIYNRVVYNSITRIALESNDLRGAFYSKVLQFAKQYTNKYFGIKPKQLTDIAVGLNFDNSLLYSVLSTDPIAGGEQTDFGFYIQKIKDKANEGFTHSWKTAAGSFTAKIDVNKLPINNAYSSSTGPKYEDLTKDGKLSGMVFISDNLMTSSPRLLKSYMSYYTEKGYIFDANPTERPVRELLNSQIGSGALDYLVKEAHASGNSSDFIRSSSKVKVFYGSKTLLDGSKEEIQIIVPTEDSGERLTVEDIKSYFTERSSNKGGELIYINGSCSSSSNARNEIATLNNKLMVNIPSSGTTTSFMNTPTSSRFQIQDGILARESYAQIRQRVQQTPRYLKRKHNDFIFPDEERYKTELMGGQSHLYVPSVSILDQNNQPYYIDSSL